MIARYNMSKLQIQFPIIYLSHFLRREKGLKDKTNPAGLYNIFVPIYDFVFDFICRTIIEHTTIIYSME